MKQQRAVLISGASIAGPTLAYWLNRYGFKVTVVERAPALRMGGQNVDISGAARTVIKLMGIEQTIRDATTTEVGACLVDQNGVVKAEFPIDKSTASRGTKEIEILRGQLAKILYEHTRDQVEYVFGDQIKALHDQGDRVTVSFNSAADRDFDLVVAADGVRSRTRKLILGSEPAIRSMGIYCAVLPIPRLPSDNNWWRWYNAPGRRHIDLRPDNLGTIRAALWFISKPVGYEYLPQAELIELLKSKFADAGWEAQRILSTLAESSDLYFDHISQVHAPTWFKGRGAIVGDCAYAPSPLSGVGTTVAIIGAHVLAGELARHEDHQVAFAAYEKLMRPFVNLAQRIPPGVPWIAHPKSKLGISLLHKVAKAATSRWFKRKGNGLGLSPADKIELPDYAAGILKTTADH